MCFKYGTKIQTILYTYYYCSFVIPDEFINLCVCILYNEQQNSIPIHKCIPTAYMYYCITILRFIMRI